MTTNEKVARRKLSLLALAKELNNVSKACKLIGCQGAHPNRVAPEIEQAILDYSLTRPTHGPLRVAQELVARRRK